MGYKPWVQPGSLRPVTHTLPAVLPCLFRSSPAPHLLPCLFLAPPPRRHPPAPPPPCAAASPLPSGTKPSLRRRLAVTSLRHRLAVTLGCRPLLRRAAAPPSLRRQVLLLPRQGAPAATTARCSDPAGPLLVCNNNNSNQCAIKLEACLRQRVRRLLISWMRIRVKYHMLEGPSLTYGQLMEFNALSTKRLAPNSSDTVLAVMQCQLADRLLERGERLRAY
ncbi:uncharacterized protein [Triticum aestivum]|uniref:uncharacterized protein n=1 Tax=Triticum aestivum TaxID=4565 RepID=UPI001D0108B4|nr:uncharacterized protein LOC123188017 [Triticum aestivum]